MKIENAMMLAGAAVMIVAASSVHATPTITAVYNFSDPFLVANNLMSVTISVTGFSAGNRIQGFISTPGNPWVVRTNNGSGFFNIDTVANPSSPSSPFFTDGVFAAPTNNAALNAINPAARWDSGFIGSLTAQPNPANLGSPTDSDPDDDIGGFAMFSTGGNSDIDIYPAAWITISPTGIPVNETSNFRVMRLTWPINALVRVDFVLAMNTPAIEIPMTWGPPLWDSGGPCCLPNGGCEEMFIIPCLQQGGTLLAPIVNSCENCPNYTCMGDIAPAGGDNIVNVEDLLAVINAWGPCANPNNCPADLAPRRGFGNNIVNVADLLAVVNRWGACPP